MSTRNLGRYRLDTVVFQGNGGAMLTGAFVGTDGGAQMAVNIPVTEQDAEALRSQTGGKILAVQIVLPDADPSDAPTPKSAVAPAPGQ